MDILSTGIQEVTRRFRRRNLRRSLRVEAPGLEHAEIDLGREAWRELGNASDVSGELAGLLSPLRRIDAEGAETRAKLVKAERAIAALREEEIAARRPLDDDFAKLEAERASLRQAREKLPGTPSPTAPADADDGTTTRENPHRRLLEQLQEVDRRDAGLKERRRERERKSEAEIESLRQQLLPLQLAQEQMDQARRDPLRRLGQYLAQHEDAVPPAAMRHLALVRQRRTQMTSLEQREVALAHESRQADPQSLRLSLFVFTTFAVLAALALLLIFRAPPRRDWLPANTELLISANVARLSSANAAQAGHALNPIWAETIRPLAQIPTLANPAADVRRVVRAVGLSVAGRIVEYDLVETLASAADVLSTLNSKYGFGQRFDSLNLGGLPIYEQSTEVACAQIGPETIAVGNSASVEQMIRVRLGLSGDLKIDEQFFAKFQRLDRGSAFRVVTRRPDALVDVAGGPLFASEFLGATRLLGFAIYTAEPVPVVCLLRAESEAAAALLAAMLRERGAALLRLEGGMFAEPPVIELRESEVEFRFVLGPAAAREFLNRVAGVSLVPSAQ